MKKKSFQQLGYQANIAKGNNCDIRLELYLYPEKDAGCVHMYFPRAGTSDYFVVPS